MGIKIKPSPVLVTLSVMLCLFIGLFAVSGVKSAKKIFRSLNWNEANAEMVAQPVNVLILSDFEAVSDLDRWDTGESSFERSADHAAGGKFSGKAIFFDGVTCSKILMDEFFEDNTRYGNWSGYSQLRFDVYNAGNAQEQLTLKIKDRKGKSWRRTITAAPGRNTEVRIPIADLRPSIDPSRIVQFNLFRWTPATEATFYIDNIRLTPFSEGDKSPRSFEDSKVTGVSGFLFEGTGSSLGIGIESSAQKIFKDPGMFTGRPGAEVELSMARNEYESAQAALYAKKAYDDLSLEASDLTANIDGRPVRLSKQFIRVYVVGYVKTRKPGYEVSYVGWWPDPLENKGSFYIEENTVQPIWIEVYMPEEAPAGDYSGTVTLRDGDKILKSIGLKVKVWDVTLPRNTHLKTAFDFYDGRLKRMYPQDPGEDNDEYMHRLAVLQERYVVDMIRHRIMPIFNFPIKDAFFGKDIKPYLNIGLSAFAVGRYGGSFDNNWPKDPEGLSALEDVYRDHARVLKAAGLLDMAYIYAYDEPKYGDPDVDNVTKMIHKADPGLKNMVCLYSLAEPEQYPGWGEDIDIWCVRNAAFDEKIVKKYQDKGKDVWVYVSGPQPPYPTLVIDYPAMAYRIVPWQCWKYGLKGYLFWCVNFWDEDPWKNPMNTKWEQNGNGAMYYPGKNGPVTSIRLEVLRDGLEDYEYLYMLSEKLKEALAKGLGASTAPILEKSKALLNIGDDITGSMAEYTVDPQVIDKRRSDIAEAIMMLDKEMR